MKLLNSAAVSLALLASPVTAKTSSQPVANVAAAVAAPGRSADNLKLDESRKPAEVLRFLALRSGMKVLDPFGLNKYWAEITAPVVGPKGHVTVWQPTQFMDDKRKAEFDDFAAEQGNVTLITSPFEAPNLPEKQFDFALINLDYHDVYWE